MSEQTNEDVFGKASNERSAGYEKMPLADPLPPKERTDITSARSLQDADEHGLSPKEAAELFIKRKAQEVAPNEGIDQAEPIPRAYLRHGTSQAMPDNLTVELDQAARDVANARIADRTADEVALDLDLQNAIDALRAGDAQPEQQQPQQPQQEQPQEQPHPQPALEGDDVARALQENPKLLAAFEQFANQQTAATQHVQQQYAADLQANAGAATASIFAAFPELQGLQTADQLQGAISAVERQNPQRGMQLRQHIANVQQLSAKAQEVQQHQMQAAQNQYRQQFENVAAQADSAYDNWITQQEPDAGRRQEISSTAKQILLESGLSPQELSYHWSTSPILRSFTGQQILADAARFRMSKAIARTKAANPVPTVQRPGSPAARISSIDYDVGQLNAKLNKTGNPRDAANLLIARRSGRR